MSRQYVKYKDKWLVFSSIVDGFITDAMTEQELDKWRENEYGRNLSSKEYSLRNMDDALYSLRMNRTHDESVEELKETGFSENEAEELIHNLEMKYYKPKEKDGKYYCPNCGEEVKYLQDKCTDDRCEMEFVWK